MNKEKTELKKSIYVGMCIFNCLKGSIIRINDEIVSFEEKKYLSLYFGMISIEGDEFNNLEYRMLELDEYIDLYKNYFIEIFKNIDFNSKDNYYNFLLEQPIIKRYNNNKLTKKKNSNKTLIKK